MKRYLYLMAALAAAMPAWAMAPSQGEGKGGNPFGPFLLIGGIFAIMYFFMIRPEQKRRKAKEAMLANVAPGDRIVTNGGIYGVVKMVRENTVRVQIDDQTRIELSKSAIAQIVEKTGEGESQS